MLHGTTILCVRRDGKVALGGDGQVTLDKTVMKGNARKVRRLGDGSVIAGFAGGTADAFSLFERSDRALRRLEALLLVADVEKTFLLSGSGDVIEPDGGAAAVGSGGPYALAAAQALLTHSALSARAIAEAALGIASEICIYTNDHLSFEEL